MSKNKKRSKNNSVSKTVYSKEDYINDRNSFNKSVNAEKTVDYSAFKRLMLHDLCVNTSVLNDGYIGQVNLDDIVNALKYPKSCWKVLLEASEELMRVSPYYFRMNNFYSNMALFCWGVDLYDVKEDKLNINTLKNNYRDLSAKLESMNLKHEFSKIMKVLPYQDVYYGLVVENSNDFFVLQVDPKICKLSQIQDGLYNFSINLAAIKPQYINSYPDYVQQAFLDFKDGKYNDKWYAPSSDKQICVKLNSQYTYPYPLLIGLIRDLMDLDTYKKLKLQSARTDNYKAIMVEVPIDKNSVDKPLLTPETLGIFAEINRESMSDDIGLIHTLGSSGEAISFKDSSNTRNNVSDAVDELYNSSGLTKEAFNGSSSGTAVTMSIETDSGFIYGLYRQFERWINRYIKQKKYNKSTFKFHFYLLDITIFNRKEMSSFYKDACTLGAPVVDKWLASLDMTPSRTMGSFILHKDIFDYQNNFVPLTSSYNSSAEAGRPTNESKGELLDVSGEQTADSDANKDR